MRLEARKIYSELIEGKALEKIKGTRHTKNRIYRKYLYGLLVQKLINDMILGKYTLSSRFLKIALFEKKREGNIGVRSV